MIHINLVRKTKKMTESKNKFYVTTPIYYVTAKPHLGSLYSTLIADVAKRWNQLQGKKTFFVTGTDEHGQKVAQAAEKAGKDPQEFVDSFIPAYKDMWQKYDIVYDNFIRTTDTYHVKAVQQWIKDLQKSGDIYKSFYKGWYCTPCETFVTETESEKKDGSFLCPSCNRPTKEVAEETYFFKLSAYQDKLLKFYKENPNFIVPKERAKEVINFVKGGLKDLSISRTTVDWGVAFPDDKKHVAYVWADALNNYITAVGYGQKGKEQEFNMWWPADLHVLGKDIVRFHAIYWPAFLMASNLPLPKQLLVHGWIKVDQKKMSKSLGNAVDPQVLLDAYGAEPVRYYLLRQMSITQDGDFSIIDLEQRIASDLANDLGNLLNRMTSLAAKNNVIEVVAPKVWAEDAIDLRDESLNLIEDYATYMSDYTFHMALARVWKFINQVNAYFHGQEPWKIAKIDKNGFIQILSATCHSLYTIAHLLWPVMPKKMEELLKSLGVTFTLKNNTIDTLEFGKWQTTFMLHKIEPLFEKPEERTKDMSEARQTEKAVDYIKIDDFAKVHLIVGTIEQCEKLEGSDKLLKLQVNCGDYGVRQILSGIKKHYSAQDLLNKQGVFVVNLKPRKMMGIESQGMMLFVEGENDTLPFVTVSGLVSNGSRLR